MLPPTFSMVHLLHRLYGVDAPAGSSRPECTLCPGRLGSKLDELKAKYLRSEAKVRSSHNAYLIALKNANLYQRQYSCVILPALLDAQQQLQEDLVQMRSVTCHVWFIIGDGNRGND